MMIDEDTLESFQDPNRKTKCHTRLDIKSKVLIIHALNNGQSKTELAKFYNVSPQTITNISKKKEFLLEKYIIEHKQFNNERVNIDQVFLEWFLSEAKSGNYINKNSFHHKALEIINTMGVNSVDINDWIQKIQMKHHITEFVADINCSLETQKEWMEFISNFDTSNVYFGGLFGLSHTLDLERYMKGDSSEDHVSIMFAVNASGIDKQQLAVFGKDVIENPVISLPVQYYICQTDTPLINYSILNDYLKKWDNVLRKVGKNILLIINLPDHLLHRFNFQNIKLLAMRNLEYVTHLLEKIIECFKFHYRRLQISNRIENVNYSLCQASDYIHMIAMAWHCVSGRYIELLSSPKMDGLLYFNVDGENYGNHSLSHWLEMKNFTLDFEQRTNLLDRYINCDSKLKCEDWRIKVNFPCTKWSATKKILRKKTCSSFEAYQAMRSLVSYLQDQNAGPVIRNAKYLENQIECRALTQMKKYRITMTK